MAVTGLEITMRRPLAGGARFGDVGDTHYIGIWTQVQAYESLETWQSDARVWQQRQYDLSAYIGQTMTIYVGTKNDGDDDTAALYVDDVALEICP